MSDWSKCVLVYEPLWAMNTGVIASADQTEEACSMLRHWVKENVSADAAERTQILYGGNVTETNATKFVELGNIDGFLIGSTSTKPVFRKIFETVVTEAAKHKW